MLYVDSDDAHIAHVCKIRSSCTIILVKILTDSYWRSVTGSDVGRTFTFAVLDEILPDVLMNDAINVWPDSHSEESGDLSVCIIQLARLKWL